MDSEGKKHRKEKIDWRLRGESFFSRIKPELDYLESLALFAKEKEYEMQITQS